MLMVTSLLYLLYIKNNEYFIDFFKYKELIKKVIESRKNYKDFNREENTQFNTVMYIAIRDLINLDQFSNEEKKEMVEYLNDFFNKNIDEIDDNIKISKNAYNYKKNLI